jgi:hypothetical protein
MPSTSRCCVSPSTRPPHRRFTQAVGTNSVPHFCCLVWATPGLRGRDAARGRHQCLPTGLTRITCRRADAPCRGGRPAPSRQCARSRGVHALGNVDCARGSCDFAQDDTVGGARRSPSVDVVGRASEQDRCTPMTLLARQCRLRHSRKGAPAARHDVRVRPARAWQSWPRAASRPRWPDAAQTRQRDGGSICPNHLGEPAVRRACTWRDAAPGHRGHCRHTY